MSSTDKNIYEDEKSLGELILDIKDYALYVLSYWLQIGLIVILFAGLFVLYTLLQPNQYKGEISFVVTESRAGGGGMSSVLSSFGLGALDQEGVNYNKIVSLAKSNRIHSQTLLDSSIVNGKKDLLGNHLIEIYEYEGEWKTIDVYHLSSSNIDDLSLMEKRLLKKLINIVAGENNPLFRISFDDESFVLSCSVITENEDFSIALVESAYENLSNFYVMQSISQSKETVGILTSRKDSLETILESKQVNLASLKDASSGIIYSQYEVSQLNLTREVQIATTMYLEVVKNLEMARFNLSNIKPFFTAVDMPFRPLEKVGGGWMKRGILGGFIGGFLSVMFIVLRRYISEEVESASEGRT